MQAKFTADVHPEADTVEEYVFGRLPEAVSEAFEEHLLICPRCQKAVAEADEYVLLMKQATAKLASASRKSPKIGWALAHGRGVGLGVALAALLLGWMIWPARRTSEPSSIQLVALRGDDMASIAHAQSGPLDLVIDVSDLPGISTFHLEVVDAAGRQEWEGTARPAGGKLTARMAKSLDRGTHWVRLSSPDGELLREFGLRAG